MSPSILPGTSLKPLSIKQLIGYAGMSALFGFIAAFVIDVAKMMITPSILFRSVITSSPVPLAYSVPIMLGSIVVQALIAFFVLRKTEKWAGLCGILAAIILALLTLLLAGGPASALSAFFICGSGQFFGGIARSLVAMKTSKKGILARS